MRVKKKHQNEYVKIDDIWVRNPYVKCIPTDINNLTKGDESLFLNNELINSKRPRRILGELNWDNIVIVSSGYDFKNKQQILASLPYDKVKIICVNQSLAKWHLLGNSQIQRAVSLYMVNNPHVECLSYLPKHGYWPNLLASTRSYPGFIDNYMGQVFFYKPTKNLHYSTPFQDSVPSLDDYRNSICAAVSLAVFSKVKKLLLFCCDDSFEDSRPASIQLPNGLWTYPQQLKSQTIIDTQLGWLKNNGVAIRNHSSGLKYNNAAYIDEENILDFFLQQDVNE